MHEFRMFAIDSVKSGSPKRSLRPWCVCGWLGEWTTEEPRGYGISVLRATAQKQFMESHLEPLQAYLMQPSRVVTVGMGESQ